jgi:hypothetical protein
LNAASAAYATVPGGYYNLASGSFSLAAGRAARAMHAGAFVWADSQGTSFDSTGPDPFLIRAQGGVGIGTNNPTNILTVVQNSPTDPVAGGWTIYSSRRWKTNIRTIEDAMEKVRILRGVTFDWKADGSRDVGLIAEEVGEVVPEVVAYEANGKDARSVDYARLVAVLIEALKEQDEKLQNQETLIGELHSRLSAVEKELKERR